MKTVLFLFGTRPEAIKMAPLIKVFSEDDRFRVRVGLTAQHREMLDQVLKFFDVDVHYDLNIMTPNQTLHQLTSDLISRITNEILLQEKFDLVFVQGDTATVLSAAIASFYQKIPVAHIEAGLRSHNLQSPFPEEMNRALTSKVAKFHFCPTHSALANLEAENLRQNAYVVGNTVIDALFMGLKKVESESQAMAGHFNGIDFTKRIILVTCHRRENFGEPFIEICCALTAIADSYSDDVEIVYPVHLNPNVHTVAHQMLTAKNIKLIPPLDYPELLWLMNKSHIILTDSGGIQEEAPSLGKPVLVLREVTERTEGVDAGTAILVGSSKEKILFETSRLLDDPGHYNAISESSNPYGDGTASKRIKEIVAAELFSS